MSQIDQKIKEQLDARIRKIYKSRENFIEKRDTCFSSGYIDEHSESQALRDAEYISKLSDKNPVELLLTQSSKEFPKSLHLRLFQWNEPRGLSEILPMLENFNLNTMREKVYTIRVNDMRPIYISDFSLTYPRDNCDIARVGELFQEAFSQVFLHLAESDGLNKLVLDAFLSWREVSLLRTYTKYLLQIGFRFSQEYMEKALSNNPLITSNLIALFKSRHDPSVGKKTDKDSEAIVETIHGQLESVKSLDEDRIIRSFLGVIQATLRCNYFQRNPEVGARSGFKEYIAIKFNSGAIPELPLPKPKYEIFVCSPRFEGIHLRKERIARGGLRWSDRREDFRTEVLGLMKAQVVKNTVIVPSGAKGGFVIKTIPKNQTREEFVQLGIECYKLFISALLDLTDNIKRGEYLPPPSVVCLDEPDPYLVVAADKGTATFSDIANSISQKYDFWLGDAFASGGSQGYDHKKMGITARGAWESVKRHFRELDLDIGRDEISVIGVGDMSGDVFGNGMLYSKNIALLAAFDHRDIFIDPKPNPKTSYTERERLFQLPVSSWQDYSKKLISKGGGIFSRAEKSIKITPEMKAVFDIKEASLTPTELISALLKAPCDLLFNGGIGTYVKGSLETSLDVGDRANDDCRVNGALVRAKVVGEGGNMGLTQRGRVEYSEQGGLVYTDFIDNSAGVDCSDHEVNLKILLDQEVEKGRLNLKDRNSLLGSLIEEVAMLVLNDNKAQALVMSFSAITAKKNIALHSAYIKFLEQKDLVNREVEFLPADKELAERKASGLGLTRPELAILLSYTKIYVKNEILKSNLPEDPYLNKIVYSAFPPSLKAKYAPVMEEHRLRREIVATQLANKVINQMGFTFVYRMEMETGANVSEIIRAYTIAADSFETGSFEHMIESLDFKIPMAEQFDMMRFIRKLLNLSTRWFLNGNYHKKGLEETITVFNENIKKVKQMIPELMSGMTKVYLDSLKEKFAAAHLPLSIAEKIGSYRAIYTVLNIVEVALANKLNLEKTAKMYFAIGERMKLVWFRDELANDTREDYWCALTRLTIRDELDILQRALTLAVIKTDEKEANIAVLIEKWEENNPRIVARWDDFLSQLHRSTTVEYSMFFIAIHELTGLLKLAHKE